MVVEDSAEGTTFWYAGLLLCSSEQSSDPFVPLLYYDINSICLWNQTYCSDPSSGYIV